MVRNDSKQCRLARFGVVSREKKGHTLVIQTSSFLRRDVSIQRCDIQLGGGESNHIALPNQMSLLPLKLPILV